MVSSDRGQQESVVGRALECGINFFDVAPAYGNGLAESNLGRILSTAGARPVIATKVALSWRDLSDVGGACEASVRQSLERLSVDRVDVIQLHNHVGARTTEDETDAPGPRLGVEEILGTNGIAAALRHLRDEGVVGAIGFTTFRGEGPAARAIVDSGEFNVMDIELSIFSTAGGTESGGDHYLGDYAGLIGAARRQGMGVFSIRPFGGGSHRRGKLAERVDRPVSSRRAESFGDEALGIVLGIPGVSSVVVGMRTIEHVDAAAAAAARAVLVDGELESSNPRPG